MMCWTNTVVGIVTVVIIIQQDESSQDVSDWISDSSVVPKFMYQIIWFCREPIFSIFAVTGVNEVVNYTIWNTTLNKVFLHKNVIVSSHHRSLHPFADTRADNISFEGGRFSLSVSAAVCWSVVRDWYHAAHRYI